jgi:hypothetical protein
MHCLQPQKETVPKKVGGTFALGFTKENELFVVRILALNIWSCRVGLKRAFARSEICMDWTARAVPNCIGSCTVTDI